MDTTDGIRHPPRFPWYGMSLSRVMLRYERAPHRLIPGGALSCHNMPMPLPYKLGQGIIDPSTLIAQLLADGVFGTGGGGGTPAAQPLTVTYSGGAWSSTPSQVATARAAGSTITWAGTTVLPTTANGLAEGDAVSGTFTQPAPSEPLSSLSIATHLYPTQTDAAGVSSDTVTLWGVPGVKWTVNGVAYDSMGTIPNAVGYPSPGNIQVPTGGSANVTVTAAPSDAAKWMLKDPTTSWSFTFDTTVASQTPVTIAAGQVPVAVNNGATSTFGSYVTLTQVTGVTWTVDGVDYPSENFPIATWNVTYLKGTNTTVTAKASSVDYVLNGTTSWPLTFTNANGNTALPIVQSSSFAGVKGQTYGSTITTVPGFMDGAFGGTVCPADLQNANVDSSANVMVNGFSGRCNYNAAGVTTQSRMVEFTNRGNGSGGAAAASYVSLMSSDTNGIRLYLSGGNATVWTASGGTYTAVTASAVPCANGDRMGIAYDKAKSTVYVMKNGAVVWTGTYANFTPLYGSSQRVDTGSNIFGVAKVIQFGA